MFMNPITTGLMTSALRVASMVAKAVCLRHGCTEEEVATIRASGSAGIHPCLASIRAGDGREILRLTSIAELDDLLTCPIACASLAKAVRLACRGM